MFYSRDVLHDSLFVCLFVSLFVTALACSDLVRFCFFQFVVVSFSLFNITHLLILKQSVSSLLLLPVFRSVFLSSSAILLLSQFLVSVWFCLLSLSSLCCKRLRAICCAADSKAAAEIGGSNRADICSAETTNPNRNQKDTQQQINTSKNQTHNHNGLRTNSKLV